MSRFVKTTFVCASCGRERGTQNHWFVVIESPSGGALYVVFNLDPSRGDLGEVELPVCGEQCLHKIEAKIIAGVEI